MAAFCAAPAARPHLHILELGSGPGQLAREILVHCDVHTYVALDFSPAMHEIAAEHLGEHGRRVTFVTRDFREPAWPANLGTFDAIVTLQAAHETRHERHLVRLLERARTVLAPGGILLYADHYLTPETTLRALHPSRADQPRALECAGFVERPAAVRGGEHGVVGWNEPGDRGLIGTSTQRMHADAMFRTLPIVEGTCCVGKNDAAAGYRADVRPGGLRGLLRRATCVPIAGREDDHDR